jgi:hypothetical protein
LIGARKMDSVHAKQKVAKWMVVVDLILCNFEAEHRDIMVECFQGIKTEQLNRLTEKRKLL